MHHDAFLHWHLHYEGSQFDGMIQPSEAEEDALEYDKPCLAITDHGTLKSALGVYGACQRNGWKFVPGSELYVVNDKSEKLDGPRKKKFDKRRHIVLLSINQIGFENLIWHSTSASMHFFMKPRIQHRDLWERNEGLIISTACLGGLIASPLLWDDQNNEEQRIANATKIAMEYREVFGDRFYLEIQPVYSEAQLVLNRFLIKLHKEHGFPILATNDAHYAKDDQHKYHAHLISIQNRSRDSDGELVYKRGHHLRNLPEMRDGFKENGTYGEQQSVVELALETANSLHERMSGVLIKREMKIPEYKPDHESVDF